MTLPVKTGPARPDATPQAPLCLQDGGRQPIRRASVPRPGSVHRDRRNHRDRSLWGLGLCRHRGREAQRRYKLLPDLSSIDTIIVSAVGEGPFWFLMQVMPFFVVSYCTIPLVHYSDN